MPSIQFFSQRYYYYEQRNIEHILLHKRKQAQFYLCDYNILVMDLMGPSLQSLFNQTLRKFSLKTVLMLIDQMIQRVQYIHRDIKPDNFCIGFRKTSNKIFIVNFGLAKKFTKERKHIEYKEGLSPAGAIRYSSINNHLGIQQSRRDDMEGIGYVAIYFLIGMLPWQGMKGSNRRDRQNKVIQKKIETSIETLCGGCPKQFATYLSEARNLKFDEKPNYSAMRKMFKELLQNSGYKYDYQYDWVTLAEKKEEGKMIDQKKEGKQI